MTSGAESLSDVGEVSCAQIAAALPGLLTLVRDGTPVGVTALEVAEVTLAPAAEHGDLVAFVGVEAGPGALRLLGASAPAAGVVVRERVADDAFLDLAERLGRAVLTIADDTAWGVALPLLRGAVERLGHADDSGADPADARAQLFDLADRASTLLGAPVTVEDTASRVLAYSRGQTGIDAARTSTIVGRRVPREVRDHFRARGVFRHLASGTSGTLFVPAGEPDIRPRLVIPVHAGGEWLGSLWAVVDGPVDDAADAQVRAVADVAALHLLRLRSRAEVADEVIASQLLTLLTGSAGSERDWLPEGPWRVVALGGLSEHLPPDARRRAWHSVLRRRGWRTPLIAGVDERVYALLVAHGDAPGSWAWLGRSLAAEAARDATFAPGAAAGAPAATPAAISDSRTQAAALLALPGAPAVARAEDHWAQIFAARARAAMPAPDSPLGRLHPLADPERLTPELRHTLAEVIAQWGEPQRAADRLGVHPNTVRNRMARITATLADAQAPVDLAVPDERMACWLLLSESTHSAPPRRQ